MALAVMMTVSMVSTDALAAVDWSGATSTPGIDTLDDGGTITLLKGETKSISCDKMDWHSHTAGKSNDTTVATVTSDTSSHWGRWYYNGSYKITAVSKGETEITICNTTYKVIVNEVSETSNIYVYIQFIGISDKAREELRTLYGLDAGQEHQNIQWYTIGKLSNVNIPEPAQDKEQDATDEQEAMAVGLLSSSLERYQGNTLPLDWITDWDLHNADGADGEGYKDEAKGKAWHLDGKVDLSKLAYTVKYVDKDTNEIIEEFAGDDYKKPYGEEMSISSYQKEISNYIYDGVKFNGETVTNGKIKIGLNKNELVFYYKISLRT